MDTSIWSLGLRRRRRDLAPTEVRLVEAWTSLVGNGWARLIGPVRQEVLSGIRSERDFERLRDRLADFDDVPLRTSDYEQAARFWNLCRAKGVTGGQIDLLICAAAHGAGLAIFTTDPDFALYARHVPVRLYRAISD